MRIRIASHGPECEDMHESCKGSQRDRGGTRTRTAARGHQGGPVAPAEAEFVACQPRKRRWLAHAAATSSATSARKVSSRLVAVFPV